MGRETPSQGGGNLQLDKFLSPEAMLTPGAAGGITMLIANALANNFGFTPSYTPSNSGPENLRDR